MSFKNYTPQLSWQGHDKHIKGALGGTKAGALQSAKIKLPGSLNGVIVLMDVPSIDSINTVTTKQSDRTDMIKRGGI